MGYTGLKMVQFLCFFVEQGRLNHKGQPMGSLFVFDGN